MKYLLLILAIIITLLCLFHFSNGIVEASEDVLEAIEKAIRQLAPRVSETRAQRLAEAINTHSKEGKIDPFLVTAIIMRESSFSFAVETGRRKGRPPQNCIGLMQIYPWGPAHKLGRYCNLGEADCNIRTGVLWLEHAREVCGDTHWQWVASYGMRRCPDYWTARKNNAAITAHRLYCQIRDNCEEIWPTKEKQDGKGRLWFKN